MDILTSIQLPIIQAFTALWKIQFEHMVYFEFVKQLNLMIIYKMNVNKSYWNPDKESKCSNVIFQRAVKAWIIGNCIDFTMELIKLVCFII